MSSQTNLLEPKGKLANPRRQSSKRKTTPKRENVVILIPGEDGIALRYTIKDEDEERFDEIVQAATLACDALNKAARFGKQFDTLLAKLGRWLKANKNKIDQAYITVRDAGLLFLVIRKTMPYDSEFEDLLTDIDIEIAQDRGFNLVELSVLALPKTSEDNISSFLIPPLVLEYEHS